MTSPESAAGKTIHAIHDRLQRAQMVLGQGPQSGVEKILEVLFKTDSPIARSELMASPEQTQKLIDSAGNIRTWLIDHGVTYAGEPGSLMDDVSGLSYKGGGFDITTEESSSSSEKLLLGIFEASSPYDPSAEVRFGILEDIGDNKYSLNIEFYGEIKDGQRIRKGQSYHSEIKSFREMPEDDAIIIEDLLTRVTTHINS